MKEDGFTEDDVMYRIVLMCEEKIYEKAEKFSDF